MYTSAQFIRIEGSHTITRQEDAQFFFELQRGVLLSLLAAEAITETQCMSAEEILQQQRLAMIQTRREQGEGA